MATIHGMMRVSSKHPVKPPSAEVRMILRSELTNPSRQLRRAFARAVCLDKVNENYGYLPRRIRRSIAFTIARREWRERVKAL